MPGAGVSVRHGNDCASGGRPVMSDKHYVLYADRPFYTRVPWWIWAVGAGVLVLWLTRRGDRTGA